MSIYRDLPDSNRLSVTPQQFAHDLVIPATYIVVKPHKGNSTTFRVRSGFSRDDALRELRRRKFAPLYIVNAKHTSIEGAVR